MWLRPGALALLALLVLTLAGCGVAQRAAEEAEEKVSEKVAEQAAEKVLESMGISDVDIEGDKVTFTVDGEDMAVTSTQGELVPDFPFPLYPGATIGFSSKVETGDGIQYMAEFTFTDDLKAVRDFYAQVLEEKGIDALDIGNEEEDHIYYGFMGGNDEMDVIINIEWYKETGVNECGLLIGVKQP